MRVDPSLDLLVRLGILAKEVEHSCVEASALQLLLLENDLLFVHSLFFSLFSQFGFVSGFLDGRLGLELLGEGLVALGFGANHWRLVFNA